MTEKDTLLKKQLETIASKLNASAKPDQAKVEWHAGVVHKMAVGIWFCDKLKLAAKLREETLKAFMEETESSFGNNASALAQSLGRPKGVRNAKIERTFAGF